MSLIACYFLAPFINPFSHLLTPSFHLSAYFRNFVFSRPFFSASLLLPSIEPLLPISYIRSLFPFYVPIYHLPHSTLPILSYPDSLAKYYAYAGFQQGQK